MKHLSLAKCIVVAIPLVLTSCFGTGSRSNGTVYNLEGTRLSSMSVPYTAPLPKNCYSPIHPMTEELSETQKRLEEMNELAQKIKQIEATRIDLGEMPIMVDSTYANGDHYKGFCRNGKKEGLGIYTRANGDEFSGRFRNDKMNGFGIITYADGKSIQGYWKDGLYVGAELPEDTEAPEATAVPEDTAVPEVTDSI